jgi:F-type H+-transporting ATPase subunit a
LEIIVTGINKQIEEVGLRNPEKYLGFLARTLALAVRLFGNMMGGGMIIGILLTITPFIVPIVMTALGLLTGMVQAYIFSILAAVYIAAATRTRRTKVETTA